MADFDTNYWQERWLKAETGWDIGYPSTPLVEYIDQLSDKSLRILIPGCGNAWEGEYLFEKGFENTWLIDLAPGAVEAARARSEHIPADRFVLGDFFAHQGQYDLILEQTFFCALHPSLRRTYAEKMHALLKPGGKLVGLLFDAELFKDHPPFGGGSEEYRRYFDDLFQIETMDKAYNSVKPRMGNELFIKLKK
jgi:SAM-dependent methyltransferase